MNLKEEEDHPSPLALQGLENVESNIDGLSLHSYTSSYTHANSRTNNYHTQESEN